MDLIIDDENLLLVEKEAYFGNPNVIFYFIGGLVERGLINEANEHVSALVAKGYISAKASLADHLYLHKIYPPAVANLSADRCFKLYVDFVSPYASSDHPGAEYAAFDIANELEERERYDEALPWFIRAAERGHEEAAIALGYAYAQGLGTAVNILEGATWFMRSLEMEPEDSTVSDETAWPVNREIGWVDWELFGEMVASLNYEDRIELMKIVGKPRNHSDSSAMA